MLHGNLSSLIVAAVVAILWLAYEPIHRAFFHRFLGGKIAPYKVPKSVVLVDDLPRLGSGKADRSALKSRS